MITVYVEVTETTSGYSSKNISFVVFAHETCYE